MNRAPPERFREKENSAKDPFSESRSALRFQNVTSKDEVSDSRRLNLGSAVKSNLISMAHWAGCTAKKKFFAPLLTRAFTLLGYVTRH